MSDFKNSLELYIAEKLKMLDRYTRPTRGSGCGNEICDVANKLFYVECKEKRTKENITIDYKAEYLKSLKDLPINTDKELLLAYENKLGKKFIVMESEAFFRMIENYFSEELFDE